MKFETKIGIGEIVVTAQKYREDRVCQDLLMEVIAIGFDRDKKPFFTCRIGGTGHTVCCTESELIGDPNFNQETGEYPPEQDEAV